MTLNEIRDRLDEMCNVFLFDYEDVSVMIDPAYTPEEGGYFILACGDDYGTTVKTVDEVMTTPFIKGKSLTEIYKDIDIIEY
ncbi:MAG: hypothetical protein HFE63_01025 [Clostridiales bacterium]|nr:hypothetical protein [Clostridiales bacterium]